MARVLVTGASRGIGLALCAVFAERGDHVIAACRRSTPELDALGVQVVEGIELRSDEAVAGLAAAIGPEGLDVVICNAAINNDPPDVDDLKSAALADAINVNTLGAVRTVLAVLPRLRAGSKVVLIAIGATALNINAPSASSYGYRMSKAALTSFGFGLARDARDRGVAVLIASPGPVDTDMLRQRFADGLTVYDPAKAISPLQCARLLRDRIDELTLENSPVWQQGPTGAPVVIA